MRKPKRDPTLIARLYQETGQLKVDRKRSSSSVVRHRATLGMRRSGRHYRPMAGFVGLSLDSTSPRKSSTAIGQAAYWVTAPTWDAGLEPEGFTARTAKV